MNSATSTSIRRKNSFLPSFLPSFLKSKRYRSLIVLLGLTINLSAQNLQFVNVNFNSSGNLTLCSSHLTGTINYGNLPIGTSISFVFPNTMFLENNSNATIQAIPPDGLFYTWTFITDGTGSIPFSMIPTNVNNYLIGGPIYSNNVMQFDASFILNGEEASATLSGNGTFNPDNSGLIEYSLNNNPITLSVTPANQQFNNIGDVGSRAFSVVLNSSEIQSFIWNYVPETDITISSGAPQNGVITNAGSFSFTESFTMSDCSPSAGFATASITCPDGSLISSNVNLNASINIVPPTFSVASLNINRPENLPDGCDQVYELTYHFNVSPSQLVELHSLNIPINTSLYPISEVLIDGNPVQFDEVPIGTNFILNTPVSVTNGFEVKVITSLNYLQFQSCAQVSNILHSSNQVSFSYKRVCSDELFSANFNLPNNLPDGAEFLGTLIGGAQEIDYSNENPNIDMYYEFLTTTGVQFGLEAPNECGIQYRAVITAEDQNGATVTLSRDAGDTGFLQELSINMGPVFIENYYDLIFQLTFGFCPYDNIDPFSGNVFVEIEIQAYCVECESSFRTLRCLRQTIQAHCIGPCTSEVGTLNEELTPKPNIKRITLGWDDIESYNEGEAPKTSLGLSGIDEKQQLRTFYPYDIFEVTAYGHIDAGVGLIGFEIAYPEMIGINFEFIKGVVCAPGDEELLNTNFTIEESLGPIFGYTDPLLRYRVYAGAPNSEIVKFRGLYRVRSENSSVAILENEFRLQFVTTEFESCDSYGMRLTFLKPNTDFKVEVMPISTSSVISELYTRNTPLSLYSFEIENKNKDLCRTSVAVIASAYGAKGGVVADFPFETRPMIDWPANIQFNEVVKAIYLPEDTYSNDISQNLNLIPNGTDTDVFLVNPTDLQKPILPPILPSNTQENVKGVYLEFMGDCSDEEIIQIVSTNFKFYDHAYVNHPSFLLNDVLDPLNLPPVFDPPTNTIDFETLPFEELGPIAGELNYNLSTLLSTPTYALNGNIYDLPISILPPTAITIDGNSVVPELENLLLYYYLTNADGTEISNNSTLGPIAEYSDNLIAPAVFNPTGYTYYFDDIIQFNGANLLGNIPVDLDCPNQTYKLTIKLIHFCKEDDFSNFLNGQDAACETYTKILNLIPALPTQIVTNSAELELVTDVSSGECYLQLTATFVNPIGKPEILQPQFFFNTPGGLILESTNSILNYEGSSEPITSTGLTFESMAAPFNSNASATFGLYPSDPDFVFEAGTQMEFIVRFRFSTTLCDLANASGISNFSILGKLKGKGRCAADGSLAANLSAFSKQLGSSVPSLQQNSICCENAPITVTTINACLGENGSLIITPNPSYTSQINYTLYSQNDAPYAGIVDLTLPISLPIGVYGLLITLDDGLQMAYTINIRSGEISPNLVTTTSIVCESTPYTATMSDGNLYNAGHTYTYSWFNQSNPGNVLSTSNPFVYNSPVQGTYQVVITDLVTGCTATHVFNIQVDDQPTTANAGADQTICLGTNATLTANALTVGTGTWSTTATGINIMNPYSNVTDVSGLTAPSYTFTYTTSNGVCPPSIDQLTVAVQNPPLANAGPPQTICTSSTTLDANNSQYGTWTLVSGNGTIDTPASNTSDVTGLSLGTNTFRWTVNNSICPAVSSDVVITVEALPPATITASGPLTFCEGGSVNLTAPAGNSYAWTLDGVSIGGITNQITATLGGVYQVTYTNSNNCFATSESLNLIVSTPQQITMLLPTEMCTEQHFNLAIEPTGGELTFNGSNYSITNEPLTISNLSSGEYELSYQYTDVEGCSTTNIQTLSVTDDCLCLCPNPLEQPEFLPQDVITGNDIASFFNSTTIQNKCIYIGHDISIENSLAFMNCNITFKAGVVMDIGQSGSVKISRSQLHGCEYMWSGIRNSGHLSIESSTVRDAQYAITMIETSNEDANGFYPGTFLSNIELSHNFVGVNNEKVNNGSLHDTKFRGVRFRGGNLLLNFEGQYPFAHPTNGLAGIKLNYFNSMSNILLIDFSNSFKDLTNGIIAQSSRIHVGLIINSPTFTNLNFTPSTMFSNIGRFPESEQIYSGPDYYFYEGFKHSGIIATRKTEVRFVGASALNLDIPEFVNAEPELVKCEFGVCSNNSRIVIGGVTFGTPEQPISNTAILIERPSQGSTFLISQNRIRAMKAGIGVRTSSISDNLSENESKINDNNISMFSPFASTGIRLSNIYSMPSTSGNTFPISIEDNTINLVADPIGITPYQSGISALSSPNLKISNNLIRRKNVSAGIGINGLDIGGSTISCNRIIGWDVEGEDENNINLPNAFNKGMSFYGCDNCDILNNLTSDTRIGIQFIESNVGAVLKENEMRNHGNATNRGIGLVFGSNTDPNNLGINQSFGEVAAVFDDQLNSANTWITPSNPNWMLGSKKPAWYGTDIRFFVNNLSAGTPTVVYPSHQPANEVCQIDPFFVCFPGEENFEGGDCEAGSILAGYRVVNQDNIISLLQKYMNSQINYDYYEPEMLYAIEKSIDALLVDSNIVIANDASGLLEEFDAVMEATSARVLNQIQKQISSYKLDSALLTELIDKNTILDSLIQSMKVLQAQLSDSTVLSDSTIWNNIHTIRQQVEIVQFDVSEIQTQYDFGKDSLLQVLTIRNNQLNTLNLTEYNLRSMNELLFKKLKIENYVFNSSERTLIDQVASTCPIIGGRGVFKARGLQLSYNDSIFHDDKQLCEAQGIAYRLSGGDSTEITKEEILSEQLLTYPSPNNGVLQIRMKSDVASDYHLKVINLTGQVMFEQNHVSSTHTINLASNNLASGNYIIAFTQNSTGKIFRSRIFYEN